MAANWNFCVRACEGEWVGLCSGDDLLLPNYVDSLWEGTKRDAACVFVMGGWETFDSITGSVRPHPLLSMGPVTRFPKTVQMLLRGPKASFAAFCFRRRAYEQVGGYNEQYHYLQDWILQFDLAKQGSFSKVDKLVARYNITVRPDLEEYRKPFYIEDRIQYLTTKIWEALDCGVAPAYVKSSAKYILFDTLRFVRLHALSLDAQTEAKLHEVACRVGVTRQWNRWKAGTWIPSESAWLTGWLRSAARKLLASARGF